jgi:hypothetical protein
VRRCGGPLRTGLQPPGQAIVVRFSLQIDSVEAGGVGASPRRPGGWSQVRSVWCCLLVRSVPVVCGRPVVRGADRVVCVCCVEGAPTIGAP